MLLADDHPVLRNTLAALLSEQPDIEVVGQSGDGQEAVELVRQLQPDIVLMDITMPKLNGIDATRMITSEFPNVRVIGLSMHEEVGMARALMRAGAVGYLCKDSQPEVLFDTLRNIGANYLGDAGQ